MLTDTDKGEERKWSNSRRVERECEEGGKEGRKEGKKEGEKEGIKARGDGGGMEGA